MDTIETSAATKIIRIGTAGWSIPRQYAADHSSEGTHLQRYSRSFSCAEINSSFYRPHRISTWTKWAESVPEDFRFSVKAPRTITHEAALDCAPQQLATFLEEAKTLGKKLGPILFQLPPKLIFNESRARTFFAMFRDLHSSHAALEPRNPTWFTTEADHLLQEFDIARVAADPPPVPEASHPAGSNKLIYYRLHGSPRMYYSAYEAGYLRSLAASIAQQPTDTAQQPAETWCIFDNTASGAALGDACILQSLLPSESKART